MPDTVDIDTLVASGRAKLTPYPAPFLSAECFELRALDAISEETCTNYRNWREPERRIATFGVVELRDVTVVGRQGLLLVRHGRRDIQIVAGQKVAWPPGELDKFLAIADGSGIDLRAAIGDAAESAAGDARAVMLSQPGIAIYGHWLLDVAPRIQLMTDHLGTLSDTTIVMAEPLPPYTKFFLDRYDIESSSFVGLDPSTAIHFESLLVPELSRIAFALFGDHMRRCWQHLTDSVTPSPGGRRRILVSREAWGGRTKRSTLSNGPALADALAKLGFEQCYPEQLTIEQQFQLFSEAEIVVGEDGSALHNTLATPPGASVVVLMSPFRQNILHAALADACGHRCAIATGEASAEGWTIDPERIVAGVRSLLGGD